MTTRTAVLSSTLFASALLAGFLACGGTSGGSATQPAPSTRMDGAEAMTFTASFLEMENNQAAEATLPVPEPAGDALALAYPAAPSCVTVTPIGPNAVKWTFANCTGPHGWTWNGAMVISWMANSDGTVLTRHESQDMVGTKDGRSWTVNGTKDILRNPQTRQAILRTEPGFSKVFNDGSKSVAFTYDALLFADHSVEGQRKLWGDWSLSPRTAGATGAAGSIDKGTPLVWDRASGCCHPVSGTLEVKRADKAATLVFGLPCGSVTINGEAKTLGACN